MKAFILNFFFKIPIWVLKFFFWKKPTYRGHQFDTQSQALISLQPSIDLTELSDKEIPKIRNLIIKNRVAQNLSISPNNYVKKVDHFVGKSKILFREYPRPDVWPVIRKVLFLINFYLYLKYFELKLSLSLPLIFAHNLEKILIFIFNFFAFVA